jgi:hypothetical protein
MSVNVDFGPKSRIEDVLNLKDGDDICVYGTAGRYSVAFTVNYLSVRRYTVIQGPPNGWRAVRDHGRAKRLGWPRFGTAQSSSYPTIPYWCIYWPAAVVWQTWVRWSQLQLGCCAHCGYNLTGNVTGVCPECGSHVESGAP